ncbi:MAG TPA: AI-2E family transporter [Candidatus Acidoferrales bacterium]|nr:AI-2E family transporter [Candidatus Acidoferrales bacterium]
MTTEIASQKRLGTALLFYGIVVLLAYLLVLVLEPFLVPLAWAVVLVVVSFPLHERLARRWGPTASALMATIVVTLVLILPTLAVIGAFVTQGMDAAHGIQRGIASGDFAWVNGAWSEIQHRFAGASGADLGTLLHRYGERAAEYVAMRAGAVLKMTAIFLFHLSVTILAMFYLFRDGEALMKRVREVLPFETEHRDRMLGNARELISASVFSTLAAAAAHGILGGCAFALTGIHSPVFWGVMMGFFSLVPVVGSAMIWVPAAISLGVTGHVGMGIVLAIVCGLIVATVDNLIRPWLISGRAEMGGLVIFISVLGGISAFGMLGLVLGPVIVATGASLLELVAPRQPAREPSARRAGAVLE